MTKRETQAPRLSRKGHDRLEDRLDRRAQALRANLSKRKQQLRARAGADPGTTKGDTPAGGAGDT